jgi:hypothetical protein
LVSDIKGGIETEVFEKRVLRRIFGPERDEVDRLCGVVVRVPG